MKFKKLGDTYVFLGIDSAGRLLGFPEEGGMPEPFYPSDVEFLPAEDYVPPVPEISGPDAPDLATPVPTENDTQDSKVLAQSQAQDHKRKK